MSVITVRIAEVDVPLKLTMRRVRLIKELTNVDLLAGATANELNTPAHLVAIAYALAGGPDTSMSLDEWEDNIEPRDLQRLADAILSVMQRDTTPPEAGEAGNPPADASPSKT